MKTLAEHQHSFREMLANSPTTGAFKDWGDYIAANAYEQVLYDVQRERDLRRLALHRVRDAMGDLSCEELKIFVDWLLEESRTRQKAVEGTLNAVLNHVADAHGKMARLSLTIGLACPFCGHKAGSFFGVKR